MARISFRQGIVRTHSNALQFTAGNTAIKHEASTAPVIYAFADGPDHDYLYNEATDVDPAWTDVPSTGTYWLYYDIDVLTGARSFGFTKRQPFDDPTPPRKPKLDQHWFDTRSNRLQQNVWNGKRWQPVLRVFTAQVQGLIISPYATGTQAGLNQSVLAGVLLFDNDNKTSPLKQFDRRGRGKFITSETPIFSQFSNLTGSRPEQSITDGKAVEPIAQYQCVSLKDSTPAGGSPTVNLGGSARGLGLARSSDPDFPCVGLSLEPISTGEVRSYVSTGYLTDDNFNTAAPEVDFTKAPGAFVFVNENGQMTTDVPQTGSLQRVATIVDQFTIFVNIQPQILYG